MAFLPSALSHFLLAANRFVLRLKRSTDTLRPVRGRSELDLLTTPSALGEPLDVLTAEQVVRFLEYGRDLVSVRAVRQAFAQIEVRHLVGSIAGEPVTSVPEHVVAHLTIFHHIVSDCQISQQEDDRDVDATWCILVSG